MTQKFITEKKRWTTSTVIRARNHMQYVFEGAFLYVHLLHSIAYLLGSRGLDLLKSLVHAGLLASLSQYYSTQTDTLESIVNVTLQILQVKAGSQQSVTEKKLKLPRWKSPDISVKRLSTEPPHRLSYIQAVLTCATWKCRYLKCFFLRCSFFIRRKYLL